MLVDYKRMTEARAYKRMRERFNGLRVTVAEASAMLLETHEATEKLGYSKSTPRSRQR